MRTAVFALPAYEKQARKLLTSAEKGALENHSERADLTEADKHVARKIVARLKGRDMQ
jgi:hypothetical protein